jgi:hypothetical protein
VRHRSSAARLHRQSDVTNRAYRVSKATLWPVTNLPGPGRSRMARASSIQFLSGSHSIALHKPNRDRLRGVATTGAATIIVGYQNASLYKIDHPCRVSLLATVGNRGWSCALGIPSLVEALSNERSVCEWCERECHIRSSLFDHPAPVLSA